MEPSILRTSPVLVVATCFSMGIVGSNLIGHIPNVGALSLVFFSLCCLTLFNAFRKPAWPISHQILILFGLSFSGLFLHQSHILDYSTDHFSHEIREGEQSLTIQVLRETGHGYIAAVKQLDGLNVNGRLLLGRRVIPKGVECVPRVTCLRMVAKIEKIPAPKNPNMFDFRRFCTIQGYPFRVSAEDVISFEMGNARSNGMLARLAILRSHLLFKIEKLLRSDTQVALAKSMILGDRKDLSRDTKESFQDSGLMHILAISGLHLGTLYLVLVFLLSSLSGFGGRVKLIKSLFIVVTLMMFYFLSGESTSCLRAVIMFSAMEMSALLGRGRLSLNALGLAALLTLLMQPNALFDVGFQLSYLAVLGIVLTQSSLEKLFNPHGKLIAAGWKLFTLSISAQILTFPLILFYFNQFSFLSFLTGIVVVPLTGLVLQSGILLLLLSSVPVASGILTIVLGAALDIIVLLATSLPEYLSGVVENVWICPIQLTLLVLIALLSVTILRQRKGSRVLALCLTMSLLLGLSIASSIVRSKQQILSVYFIEGESFGMYTAGFSTQVLDFGGASTFQQRSVLKSNLVAQQIKKTSTARVPADRDRSLIAEFGATKCLVHSSSKDPEHVADLVWVRSDGGQADYSHLPVAQMYIIDGSVDEENATKLEMRLKPTGSEVFNLWRLGGLNISLL